MKHFLAGAGLIAACAFNVPAAAQTLTENPSATQVVGYGLYGQSFLIPGAGQFENIGFSFFRNRNPAAVGQLYIFSSEYLSRPNQMNGGSANLIGVGLADSNVYRFDPSLQLSADVTYFAYADSYFGELDDDNFITYNNGAYSGGRAYFAFSDTLSYSRFDAIDYNFRLTGTPVVSAAVPEPTTWAMMIVGFGLVGSAMRRRTRNVTYA